MLERGFLFGRQRRKRYAGHPIVAAFALCFIESDQARQCQRPAPPGSSNDKSSSVPIGNSSSLGSQRRHTRMPPSPTSDDWASGDTKQRLTADDLLKHSDTQWKTRETATIQAAPADALN